MSESDTSDSETASSSSSSGNAEAAGRALAESDDGSDQSLDLPTSPAQKGRAKKPAWHALLDKLSDAWTPRSVPADVLQEAAANLGICGTTHEDERGLVKRCRRAGGSVVQRRVTHEREF